MPADQNLVTRISAELDQQLIEAAEEAQETKSVTVRRLLRLGLHQLRRERNRERRLANVAESKL